MKESFHSFKNNFSINWIWTFGVSSTYTERSDSDSEHRKESNAIEKFLDEIEESSVTSTSTTNEDYFNVSLVNHRLNKKQKSNHATSKIVGEIADLASDRTRPLRVLLDSGTSATIILKDFVNKTSRYKHERTTWKTMGGNFQTRRKAAVSFKLPEFSHHKVVNWVAHVDEVTDPKVARYNMMWEYWG